LYRYIQGDDRFLEDAAEGEMPLMVMHPTTDESCPLSVTRVAGLGSIATILQSEEAGDTNLTISIEKKLNRLSCDVTPPLPPRPVW
jgi:hypothetical protein